MNRNIGTAIALLGAGAIAGGIAAATLPASAADSAATTTGTTAYAATAPANPKSSTPVRTDEKSVATDLATKLKAAALKAVSGGTVYRIETDGDGSAYEAHMTKADGSPVTVKFDSSANVTAVQDGMGAGGPAGGPAAQGSATTTG